MPGFKSETAPQQAHRLLLSLPKIGTNIKKGEGRNLSARLGQLAVQYPPRTQTRTSFRIALPAMPRLEKTCVLRDQQSKYQGNPYPPSPPTRVPLPNLNPFPPTHCYATCLPWPTCTRAPLCSCCQPPWLRSATPSRFHGRYRPTGSQAGCQTLDTQTQQRTRGGRNSRGKHGGGSGEYSCLARLIV